MSLIGSTSFGFAQKSLHDFQNMVYEPIVALSSTNTTKIAPFNPFPNKPWFLRVSSTSLLKTLWEKEKLLVMSNFSFSHCVLYQFEELSTNFIEFEIVICKLFQFGRVKSCRLGKG